MTKRDTKNLTDMAHRRQAMLGELIDAMQDLHARRRRHKRFAATLGLVAIMGSVLFLMLPRSAPLSTSIVAGLKEAESIVLPAAEQRSPRSMIVAVSTDREIVSRYAVGTSLRLTEFVDDDQLLATLAAIDRPTGLVRTAQAIWLTSAVTDADLHIPAQPRSIRLPPL